MKLGRNGRNVGWVITALAAMVYGVGVAALSVAESPILDTWTLWGSAAMGVLFIVFLVIPFLVWQLGGRRDADRHTIGS
jgi:hypothetical protein